MKKSKIIYLSFVVIFVVVLSACSNLLNEIKVLDLYQDTITSIDEDYIIVEENQFYKIMKCKDLYYYQIFDINSNVVKMEGPLSKSPNIVLVDDCLLKFTFQSGTGMGTQWGYYYDVNRNMFSDVYYSIFDENNGNVVYSNNKKIIIRDIFVQEKYYQEISSFQKPFSNVVFPFITVEFVEKNCIKVTYLSGPNCEKVTEFIELEKNRWENTEGRFFCVQ